ncbi:MAG: lytic transglycosylase domain-containing protein [Candidatus Riflebacteria bacterium]|nr:lytic transglycosylase domain-containing protein [Candidatus Riflebacteria bacterium]
MKNFKLMLKLIGKFKIMLVLACMLAATMLPAQTFDRQLDAVAKLYSAKKYAELLKKVESLKASPELEDLKLFVQAESLKNLGRKIEALNLYGMVISRYPETEAALQSRMPHFLLQLETADENAVARLEAAGREMPTPWLRGTALEKLSEMPFLKPGRKSRIAIQALRGYHSNKVFYRSAAASQPLLKKILLKPDEWAFEDDEWLEILLLANSEGVIDDFFKKSHGQAKLLGKWGQPTVDLFKAEALRQSNKLTQAMPLYNSVINARKAAPAVMALAHQLRGDAYHFNNQHAEAIADYRVVLQAQTFPGNETAALYRKMRSAFQLGNDAETLELLNRLLKAGDLGNLFPVHIYEMGLEHFDNGRKARAVPFFMLLARNFPGHYRADDALGYSILALGEKSDEAQTLLKLLKKKYPNSFFITWVAPASRNDKLLLNGKTAGKLTSTLKKRCDAMKKMWKTDFAGLARAEAIRLTDQNPANIALYKAIIDIASANNDYNQLTAFAERLFRQTLEADRSLDTLPEWVWKAMYPFAYETQVRANAKKFGIDPFWILSIMREESHFNPQTLSRSNAHSLMQILPSTGKWIAGKLGEKGYTQKKLWEVDLNIRYGSWYLKFLADMFKGDLYLASSAYNGGQGNVTRKVEQGPHANLPVLDRLDRIPLPETRDYYKKVMGSHWNYTRLYK